MDLKLEKQQDPISEFSGFNLCHCDQFVKATTCKMFGLSVWNKLLHVSVMILVSSTLLILLTATTCNATPVTLSNNNCPVPTTSTELGTTKVLDLHKIKGHKVRLQFFYPREEASRRSQESSSDELTTMVSIANVTMLDSGSSPEAGETSIEKDLYSQDIYCQWTFRVFYYANPH